MILALAAVGLVACEGPATEEEQFPATEEVAPEPPPPPMTADTLIRDTLADTLTTTTSM
jgi:hypothetical protein